MAFAPNSRLLGCISCLSVVATCSLTASAATYQNGGLNEYHQNKAQSGGNRAVGMLTMGAIVNPDDPPAAPGAPIQTGIRQYATGSATLIAPNIVLTAAHNLDWGVDQVYLELNGEFYQGVNWAVHQDWSGNLSVGNDVAMVLLDRNVTNTTPVTLATNPNVKGSKVTISGFGSHGTGTTGNINGVDGVRRAGDNKVDGYWTTALAQGIQSDLPFLGTPNSNLQFWYDFDELGGTYNTTDDIPVSQEYSGSTGDSGGAGFINGQLAGITSWGTNSTSVFDTVAFMTNVAVYESWIQDKITVFQTNGQMDAATTGPDPELFGPEDRIDIIPGDGLGAQSASLNSGSLAHGAGYPGFRQYHYINYMDPSYTPTQFANVPEPTALLSMAGIAGLGLMRRRRSA